MHLHLCAHQRSCSPCQSLVDYGNTKTPSMHRRLGSVTLSQLAFPWEGNPDFPWEKSHWVNTVVKSKKVKSSRHFISFSCQKCGSLLQKIHCLKFGFNWFQSVCPTCCLRGVQSSTMNCSATPSLFLIPTFQNQPGLFQARGHVVIMLGS